jgi:hypothetical protein
MILITGDVHNRMTYGHPSCKGNFDEASAALKYSKLAAEEGINVTLFVTGRALLEHAGVFQSIAELKNVELGGHGWDSFCKPRMRSALWALTGSRHGPRWYQKMEITRTLGAFRAVLGRDPESWRQHAYYTDEHSYSLLVAAGIKVVSDRVVSGPQRHCWWAHQEIKKLNCGLWSVPINTSPDHDTLVHGGLGQEQMDVLTKQLLRGRTGNSVQRRTQRAVVRVRQLLSAVQDIEILPWSGEIMYANTGARVLPASAWEKLIMEQIEDQIGRTGFATLLLHPICMELLDEMGAFRRILRFCNKIPSSFIRTISKVNGEITQIQGP